MTQTLFSSDCRKQLFLFFLASVSFGFSFAQSNIFPSTSVPAVPAATDGSAIETGVKFRVTTAGYITGVRFYKGAANTGTHIGHLWSSTGTKLAEATFINESASGWQEVLFTTPVAVAINTTYVASYFSSTGYYAYTNPYFTAATVNGPLTALANGTDGGNGVYIYTAASAFPTNTYQTSNYWVDIVYTTSIGPDVTPPTVSITAPAAGNVSGTISVTATATDNIGVAGVQFLLNGVNLGTEDVASPFTISWNTTTSPNGSYTLTARARDAAGNTTTSTAIAVIVNNDTQAPTVGLTAPAAGNVTGTINVTATAADNIGVAGVQFLLDGANLGTEDVASPYSISWNTTTTTNGSHTLTARARDAAGNTTTSAGVIVTVNNDTQAPTVGITAPAAGTVAGTINVDANASDNVAVVGVQFLLDGVALGAEDLVAPYSISWNTTTIADGNHTLTARARDAAGNNTTSAAVVVAVKNDTQAPTVSITAPAAGSVTGAVTITATASDNIGVVGVQFLVNGVNQGAEDLASPYSISWNTLAVVNGTYTLTARARDASGNTTTSVGVVVTVNNDTQAPTVSITAPAAGTVAGTINVDANASDNFGVVGVQFLLDGAALGTEDIVAPYSISWNTTTIADGNHTLTARARDAAGNSTTSAAVVVAVKNDTQAPTVSVTSPSAGEVLGTVSITANATDNIGVVGVQFLVNGVNFGAEDIASPYSTSWNTIGLANGTYTLTARARDASGNTATSNVVVIVNNPADTQGPSVNITAPAAGNVSGNVTLTATAADNIGVVGVQFLLNGSNLGAEDLASPYSISWNTYGVANGTYTLTARARDAAGNTTTSASVVVTVNNSNTLIEALALNEGTGTTAADVSGSNHPGTLVNTPTWGAGKYGQGLTFNGTSNYINIPDHNDFTLDPTQSYTWSAWVKNTSFKEWSTVWSQTASNSTFFYFYAHTSTDVDGGPVTNGISVYWWNSNSIKLGAHSTNNVLTAGVWSYVAVTYDASQAQNNRFTIYVNGVDVTARTDVSSSGTLASINPTNIRVASNQPFGEYLSGSVDEVRFYKRLLSLAEVQTDMNTPIAADATPPTVTLTAPAAGTVLGTINVTADATDNSGVAGVQFLLDGVNLGAEDVAAPYSISWVTTTATNGIHTLTARARDASGNTTTSTAVVVTVNNDIVAPTVSLSEPAAGIVLGTINVSANASDNVGVAGVQFLLDGIALGAEDVAAPYTIAWNTTTVTDGNHTVTARARDAAGNSATSTAVIVTVNNDSQAPTVSITAPPSGNVSGTISVTANAADNIGVAGVQFLLNGANLGTEDVASPYSISWNTTTVANGNYTLTARARDAAGNTTTSASVVVTVSNDIQAPTVSITAPAAGNVSGTINVDANASDNIGVAGVQFLLDGVNLGAEDIASPFSISLNTTTIADGSHTLTARARDAAGNSTTSASVVVTVKNDIQAPTVSITAPVAGNVTGTISVTATASDNVGVAGVQFLLNGVNLGTEDIASPYSISWNTQSVVNGTYTLTARARDASGNSTTSAPVSVTVSNSSTLIAAINLNEGTGTAAADVSGNNHNGVLTNSPVWGAGKYGQAVSFNGTSNYINIPAHADFNLDPAQSYTWSAWVKNTNFAEWGPVWSQTVDANNFFYFYAHTTTDVDGGPVTNGISAYWWTNGGTNKLGVHSSNNVLTAGVWSYVTVTYDASQPQNNRFSIYVNGVDVTVRTDVSSTGTITALNSTNIRIASDQPFSEFLNGAIDEIRVYKRALSASEIVTDMNTPIATGIAPSVTPLNAATNVSLTISPTAIFNVDMNASTINGSTIELRDPSNALVTAIVDYNSSTRTATLTPSSQLLGSTVYTARIKGGASGVKDALGNTMTGDYVWSFTTLDPQSLPITEGPGGPILVISTASNPFSRYAVEILRAEGLNEFAAADIANVTATMLNNYDVVVLGEMTVTASQVTMFTNWVNAGGTLIAFKPSALLTPLMGLSGVAGTLSDKYLLVNTASGPGVGIVNQTIQFHGAANVHTLNGATSLATLYSAVSTATTNPAVTTINVGANGGKAVAFTYDLAKSIVYTRQGDPTKAAVETDGQSPIRPDDLFFPSYVDLNKVAIPQADEQQRLLANIIIQSNLSRKPLPRFWYLPSGHKAAVIYALDDHGSSSATPDIFNKMIANSTSGCSVDNWECLRATSWFYVGIPMTNTQAVNYNTQGFDMGAHVQNGCANFSSFSNLDASYTSQLQSLQSAYPGLPAQTGHRFHCLVWSDWLTQAKVELSHGMRFSLDYYYWPPTWANGRPGMFTGSGMPMRFADTDGSMIDVYQGVSQLVNENGIDYAVDINTLLDNAIGSQGYYGMFGTHDDYRDVTYSDVTIASAKARNVPIISAKQALTWLDGRNNSSFGNMSWSNNQLTFSVTARSNANNIRAMLPLNSATGQLISITRNGSSVAFTTQTIKGMQYAFFAPVTGTSTYVATYSSGARVITPVVTDTIAIAETVKVTSEKTKETPLETLKLDVNVMPNPSADNFNVMIDGKDGDAVTIKVTDMLGRLIETHEKVTSTGILRLGSTWKSGIYFAEVIQGDQRKVVKMIKTN